MPRNTVPTEKNARHLKTLPTESERALFVKLQTELGRAADKILASLALDHVIQEYTIQVRQPGEYGSNFISIELRKQDGENYPGYLNISAELRLESVPNPAYDPDRETEWY